LLWHGSLPPTHNPAVIVPAQGFPRVQFSMMLAGSSRLFFISLNGFKKKKNLIALYSGYEITR
jgi:hypothetical protein